MKSVPLLFCVPPKLVVQFSPIQFFSPNRFWWGDVHLIVSFTTKFLFTTF